MPLHLQNRKIRLQHEESGAQGNGGHTLGDIESRNIVVCFDGTNNEIGKLLSNVLKLYHIVEKSDRQLVYYSPGVGTVAMPAALGRWWQKVRSAFEMATGRGVDRDVLAAYCFICRHYRSGDRIFLFGFSRGAYTVRIVAAMTYLIGLLREDQVNFAGYALQAYKSAASTRELEIAYRFQRIVNSAPPPIHFMGVWDTVSSIIVPRPNPLTTPGLEELPFASQNPAVRTFRHAMAIDEFRRMFRLENWLEPQEFKLNPHSTHKHPKSQDIKQVWFAGCHSDVGGGFVEDESALSKYSLLWMLEQAKVEGLVLPTSMINHVVRGHERKNARPYTKPDVAGPLHISLTGGWKVLEYLPRKISYREWPKRRGLLGRYLPRGEPRPIPDGSVIHTSAAERKRRVEGYDPVNWPAVHALETITGVTPELSSRRTARRSRRTTLTPPGSA